MEYPSRPLNTEGDKTYLREFMICEAEYSLHTRGKNSGASVARAYGDDENGRANAKRIRTYVRVAALNGAIRQLKELKDAKPRITVDEATRALELDVRAMVKDPTLKGDEYIDQKRWSYTRRLRRRGK